MVNKVWTVAILQSDPFGNGDRVIGELLHRNELPDAFLERVSSMLGKHFYYSVTYELLKSGRDTRRRFL